MTFLRPHHALCGFSVLMLTISADIIKPPACDPTSPPETTAQPQPPPPSKAEAARVAEDPADKSAAKDADPNAENDASKIEKLYGEWILDTQKVYQELSDDERKHMGKVIQNTALSLTFFADGTLITRGAAMGINEERRGTFRHIETDEQTLILELQEDPATNDDGEVLQQGTNTTIHATFLNDDALEWTQHAPRQGIKNPYQSQTIFLTREDEKLQKFQKDLENAQQPRALELGAPPSNDSAGDADHPAR